MRSTLIAVAIGVAVACNIRSTAHAQAGPSFACPAPRDPLGQLICSSPHLSQVDLGYVQAYQALRAQLDPGAQKKLLQEAVEFNQRVRSQCGIGAVDSGETARATALPCVRRHYLDQRDVLAGRLTGAAAEEVARPLQAHVALQGDLQRLGFLPSDAVVDGVFGPATRKAITQWQKSRGRRLTGFLDNSDGRLLEQQAASLQAQDTGTHTAASSPAAVPPTSAKKTAEPFTAYQAAADGYTAEDRTRAAEDRRVRAEAERLHQAGRTGEALRLLSEAKQKAAAKQKADREFAKAAEQLKQRASAAKQRATEAATEEERCLAQIPPLSDGDVLRPEFDKARQAETNANQAAADLYAAEDRRRAAQDCRVQAEAERLHQAGRNGEALSLLSEAQQRANREVAEAAEQQKQRASEAKQRAAEAAAEEERRLAQMLSLSDVDVFRRELVKARQAKTNADLRFKQAQDRLKQADLNVTAGRDRSGLAHNEAEIDRDAAEAAANAAAVPIKRLERRISELVEEKAQKEAQERYQARVAEYNARVSKQLEIEKQQGITRLAFNDFHLDGKQLATAGTTVAVSGTYKKVGDNAVLWPRGVVIEDQLTNIAIPLLTEHAARATRSALLLCDQHWPYACFADVLGRATMCTRTTLVGSSPVPCIDVESAQLEPAVRAR